MPCSHTPMEDNIINPHPPTTTPYKGKLKHRTSYQIMMAYKLPLTTALFNDIQCIYM